MKIIILRNCKFCIYFPWIKSFYMLIFCFSIELCTKLFLSQYPLISGLCLRRGNINTIENNDTLIFACNIKSSTVKVKFENSFFYRTYKEWNLIPYSIRKIQNHVTFKAKLKEHMWEILGRKPD